MKTLPPQEENGGCGCGFKTHCVGVYLSNLKKRKKLLNSHTNISGLVDYFYACSKGMVCKRAVKTKSLFGR
jgi:DUF1680 family protein